MTPDAHIEDARQNPPRNQEPVDPSTRFTLLPPANSLPGAHWAASYCCDSCFETDYQHPDRGDGITPFYRDTLTGETVCHTCVGKLETEDDQEPHGPEPDVDR